MTTSYSAMPRYEAVLIGQLAAAKRQRFFRGDAR